MLEKTYCRNMLQYSFSSIKKKKSKTGYAALQEFAFLFGCYAQHVLASCKLLEHAKIAENHFFDRISSLGNFGLSKSQEHVLVGLRETISNLANKRAQELEKFSIECG